VRIIVVTTEPPDPFGNAASRWFYVLLRGLVERGHQVTMLSSFSDTTSKDKAEALFPGPAYDLRCFAHARNPGILGKLKTLREPYGYVFSTHLRETLRELCSAGFDVLHLEHLWSGWLGWKYANRALLNVHYLFSSDLLNSEAQGRYDHLRRLATFAAERRLLSHYPHVAALTERLVTDIRRIVPSSRARVLPLGIDPKLYSFVPDDPSGPLTVGLIGSFSWTPTYQAAARLRTRLWPSITAAVPGARLLIVGRDAVKRLGPSAEADVEIIENVPEILPYFRRLHVLLYAPPHGSGTKVKVQEAMALGVPVVTNTDGGEGIPAIDGQHWGFADDDATLIERTVALLKSASARRARRIAARELIEHRFGPVPTIDAVIRSYEDILSARHMRAPTVAARPANDAPRES
jgi:polysaccharide biosynthesis protein PslH